MAHPNKRVKPLRLIRDMSFPAVLLLAAAVGLALSVWSHGARSVAGQLIAPFLMLVLFSFFSRISLTRLREAVRDRQYLLAAVGLNFLSTPLVAFLLGWLFLRDYPALWVGLMLALVTPCTDWYLIFTDLAGGDVHRNLALLPWNLILQLVMLPFYLMLLTQKLVPLEWSTLVKAFTLYVVIPLTGSQLLRWCLSKVAMSKEISLMGFAALALTVTAMFASHGEIALENPTLFLRMAPPMVSFYIISIFLSWVVSCLLRYPRERFISFACTTTARNSPLALPLAVILFPDHPIVALSQLIEPVLEIPSLILFSSLMRVRVQKTKI